MNADASRLKPRPRWGLLQVMPTWAHSHPSKGPNEKSLTGHEDQTTQHARGSNDSNGRAGTSRDMRLGIDHIIGALFTSIVIMGDSLCLAENNSKALGTSQGGIFITESENHSDTQIPSGAVLTISLETSPGTGYGWVLVENDADKLRVIGEELEIAPMSMPGSTLTAPTPHEIRCWLVTAKSPRV